MTAPMTVLNMGNQRYFDVYLDDPSSSEDEEYVDLSRPLMSPRKLARKSTTKPTPVKTNTPDTKLPKRKPVWYYKRKKDCLQVFYVVMILLVIIIFALVLMRIIHDAAKHRLPEDEDKDHLTAIAALGNFAMGGPFGINVQMKPTEEPKASSIKIKPPKPKPNPGVLKVRVNQSKAGAAKPKEGPQRTVLPCTKYTVQDVWIKNIPQLQIESGIRLLDVNQDNVLDAIIGFATDASAYFSDQYLMCSIYFNGSVPCFGGVLALDGITGQEMWRHYTSMEVFAVNCNGDVTGDGVNDCAIAGRAGVMEVVDGTSGGLVWKYTIQDQNEMLSNFYTAQFIHDIDNDGVRDLLNIMGGDPVRKPGAKVKHSGNLMLLSGSDGHAITMCEVPDGMESYYSPQIYYKHGGQAMVLFGTGGETVGGSLWVLSLDDLIDCNMSQAQAVYTDQYKGVMAPPVLVDLTSDGVMDIVISMFNSTILAFNGQSYGQLWNYTFPSAEAYSTPAAAFYNDDDTPDFMVTYNHGPGYPLYYYSETTVLDGRNGQPLLQKSIISSGTTINSPLTISTEDYGNDAYFYWRLGCEGHEEETEAFSFSDHSEDGIGSLSRTNFCKERFRTGFVTTAYLLNKHMGTPGQIVYNSADRFADEHKYEVNATRLAMDYIKKNPGVVPIVLNALKNQNEHSQHTTLFTPSPKSKIQATTSTTSANPSPDFMSEYDKLMDRLSALSDNLQNEGNAPVDDLYQVPYQPIYTSNENYKDPVYPKEGVGEMEADTATSAATSTVLDVLSGDFAGKLAGLGLPESWFDPGQGETHREDPDEPDPRVDFVDRANLDAMNVEDDTDNEDDLENLSKEDIKGLLEDLFGLDTRDSGRSWSKRSTNSFSGRSDSLTKTWSRSRSRRHAGLHDAGGIQRLISTGTLAPPLSPVLDDLASDPNSIDVIFATYWFYPKPNRIITAKEQKCLDEWADNERQRMDPSNEYYGLDHDAYEHLGSEHCQKLAATESASPTKEPTNPLNVYPFNLDAGEMTVYRLRLSCDCGLKEAQKTNPEARCTKILPYHQQEWGAYMGTFGNSYFGQRLKDNDNK